MKYKRISYNIALTAICAALYAISIGLTAPISTPWGIGHMRPGVVIPAFFAIVSGPYVAALGAALGSFIGDILFLTPLGLTTPLLALIAGVPANFVGFLIFGYLFRKFKAWSHFVWITVLTLFIGNFIAAAGVVIYLSAFGLLLEFKYQITILFGLTMFWLVSMLPFMFIIVPPLVRTVGPLISKSIMIGLEPAFKVVSRTIIIGIILLIFFFMIYFTPFNEFLVSAFVQLYQTSPNPLLIAKATVEGISILSLISGIILIVISPFISKIGSKSEKV